MKVYGNSKDDGFGLLSIVMGGVFALGGAGLSFMGGFTLLPALVLLAVVAAVMMRGLQKWDVMSEVPALTAMGEAAHATPAFPMAAGSDVHAQPAKAAWAPSMDPGALPAHVERPKQTVETNTPVV
jgi:hypothetical protein